MWVRFHDDILTVVENFECGQQLFRDLRLKCSGIFTVKCESVHSAISGPFIFLDLELQLTTSKLLANPSQEKPVIPLCPTSAHSPGVHRSWPSAVANRIGKLSTCKHESLCLLYHRYMQANAHAFTLKVLHDLNLGAVDPSQSSKRGSDQPISVFVLRYHPRFARAFRKALHLAPFPPDLRMRFLGAWKNALPSLASMYNKNNRALTSVGIS